MYKKMKLKRTFIIILLVAIAVGIVLAIYYSKDPPLPTSCPEGQWSASGDFTDCKVCSECSSAEIVDTPCTQTTDTTCKDDPSVLYDDATVGLGYNMYTREPISGINKGGDNNWNTQVMGGVSGTPSRVIWWEKMKLWIASSSGIASSKDGVLWESIPNAGKGAIACDDQKCVVIKNNGSDVPTIHISTNAIDWTQTEIPTFPISSITKLVLIDGKFIVGGFNENDTDSTLAYSDDGINWVDLGYDIFGLECTDIVYNGDLWVATGSYNNGGSDTLDNIRGILAISVDGKTWTKLTLPTEALGWTSALAWNGREWLAIFTGMLFSSTDGAYWSQRGGEDYFKYFPTGIIWSGSEWICYGNDNLLGYGGDAYVSTSPDGVDWDHVKVEEAYTTMASGKVPTKESFFVSYAIRGPYSIRGPAAAPYNRFADRRSLKAKYIKGKSKDQSYFDDGLMSDPKTGVC